MKTEGVSYAFIIRFNKPNCFINICFTTSNSIYNQVIVAYFCDSLNSISIIGFICSRNGNKQMVSTATSSIL